MLMLLAVSAGAFAAMAATGYKPFTYKNFRMELPAGTDVNITSRNAVMKNPRLGLGFTLSVEKDVKATPDRAMRLCNALVREMDVKHGSEAWRVTVGGMKGARAEGMIEGARVSLLVLCTGSGYLRMVAIDGGGASAQVDHTLKSIRR